MSDIGGLNGGGNGDVISMENRMEDMEHRLSGMQDELLIFSTESMSFKDQLSLFQAELKFLNERQNRQEDDVRQIKEAANRMEMHFNEVMRRWDVLDARVFEMYNQSNADNKSERKVLIDLLKYVLGGTIFAIIAFLFKGGI